MKHQPVASYRHSLVFLGIVAVVILAGFAAQNRQVEGPGLVESHVNVIPIYLSVTVMNWLLTLFTWKGIRKRGGNIGSLVGGRWGTPGGRPRSGDRGNVLGRSGPWAWGMARNGSATETENPWMSCSREPRWRSRRGS